MASPFVAATDYADVFRRSREFSHREKGVEHEEILAHRTALDVHLRARKRTVNGDQWAVSEAAACQREHDEIVARVGAGGTGYAPRRPAADTGGRPALT
jgi:hypothetical protein